MKKKIITICTAALCVAMVGIGAYASKTDIDLSNTVEVNETAQLQAALDNSAVLKSLYNTRSREDDIAELDEEVQTETYGTFDAQDAVKVYNVSLNDTTTSLKSQLNKDNDQWLLVETIKGKTTYIYMRKGGDYETAEKKINSMDVPDSLREKMLENAKSKAGKWYVERAEQPINDTENREISLNGNAVTQNDNAHIKDMKYICIDGIGTVSVWLQTDTGEYVVPLDTSVNTADLSGNSVYSLTNVANNIVR